MTNNSKIINKYWIKKSNRIRKDNKTKEKSSLKIVKIKGNKDDFRIIKAETET